MANDPSKRFVTRTAIARLLLGCVLCVGGSLVWQAVVKLASRWLANRMNAPKLAKRSVHTVQLRHHAEPLIRIENSGDGPVHRYTTLAGQPVSLNLREKARLDSDSFYCSPSAQPVYFHHLEFHSWRIEDAPVPMPWTNRLSLFRVPQQIGRFAESWYFVWPDRPSGSGYFVGYNDFTKGRIGYLGLSGTSETRPAESDQFPAWDADPRSAALLTASGYGMPFSNQSSWHELQINDVPQETGTLFLSPQRDAIHLVNLTRGTVSGRTGLPDRLSGVSTRTVIRDELPPRAERQLVLVWPDRLEFTTTSLESLQTVKLPDELRNRQMLTLAEQAEGQWVAVATAEAYRRGLTSLKHDLVWFTTAGDVTRREQLTLPVDYDFWDETDFHCALSFLPASLNRVVIQAWYGDIWDGADGLIRRPGEPPSLAVLQRGLRIYVGRSPWIVWPCLASGLPFAIACCWRLRKNGSWLERLTWPALVYLFGLVGWVAFVTRRPNGS